MIKRNQARKNKKQNSDGAVTVSGNRSGVTKNPVRTLFPVKTQRILHYHETVSLSSTTGAVATYVFATNGLYDPNITGTGHQPAGFDQVMLFYNHYYVSKASIRVNIRNTTTSVSPTCILSVNGSATAITNTFELQEDGSNVMVKLGPPTIDNSMATLVAKCDVGKFGGVKDLSDVTAYQGDASSNPAELSYFHLSFWDDEKAQSCDMYADVLISFTANFIEPRDVAPSLLEGFLKTVVDQQKSTSCTAVGKAVVDEGKGQYVSMPSVLVKNQKWVLIADPETR